MGINTSSITNQSLSTSSSSSASSIPTSPLDIEVEHLETFRLVWLGSKIHDDEQNQTLQKRLRQYITILDISDDLKKCEQWLKNRSTNEKIFLIISDGLGKKFVPNIHQLISIIGIYIFSSKPENYLEWSQDYVKIRGVISTAEPLLQKISNDEIYFQNIEDSKGIKIFKNDHQTRIPNPEHSSFIWFPLFLETLLSSSYLSSSPSSNDLIQILRRFCSNDENYLNLINEFEQTYDKQNAITWLTNNTPLRRFINKALLEQNISMLFYLRFFLIDIHNQLINNQLNSVRVYQQQLMLLTDIENIRINVNNYLIFNQFLYTSTRQSELLSNDLKDNRYEIVLIEIRADNRDGTAPFACLQKIFNTNNNQDGLTIIFMCASIFKIVSLTKNSNSYWKLELLLAENKDLSVLNSKQQKLRRNKDLLMIIDLLDHSNQLNKANIYSQHLLRELSSDHFLIPQIKKNINSKVQPVSLRSAQFIVIDLSTRLNPLASAMLKALCLLTKDSILMRDNYSEIDFDTMINKTIVIFTSSQLMSSMKKTHSQLTHYFILEDNNNEVAQPRRFNNSEDLIFQLADELYRYYKWEADDDSKAGNSSTAKEKEELANQIDNELKKVQRRFSENDDDKLKSYITTIIWLKSIDYNDDDIQKIQNRFKNIVSSFSIFVDEEECFNDIITTQYDNSVFLIIDDDYQDVSGFQYLHNIKKIYRYVQSCPNKETINVNCDHFCLELIHDLISHYNKLGTECKERQDSKNAKDMFLKARHLSEALIEF